MLYQNGLTGEQREVTPEESDWYEKNPPWFRVDPARLEPYPAAKPEAKATARKG